MRILLVSEDIPYPSMGGLAKHVLTLARALIRAGHKVDLLGGNQHPIDSAGEEGQFGGSFFGELHGHLAGWKESKIGMYLPPKRPWIARKMAQCIMAHAPDYDVIHYHGHFPNIAKYIPRHINFVQTRHDQGSDCLKNTRFRDGGICNRLNPSDCADCITSQPNALQRAISASAVSSYRRDVAEAFRLHKTIFVSDMLRRNFTRVAGSGDWDGVLHNFVDLEKIQATLPAAPLPMDPEGPVLKIFFAGMLYGAKGIEALLQTFVPIMPVNMQLIIAGSGPDEQRLREHYENERVAFLGWCDYLTVLGYIKICDVMVVPSIWEEPCATTILEGLALGKSTYALDRGGTPELVVYERYPRQLKLFQNIEELALNLAQLKTHTKTHVYKSFTGDVSNCVDSLLKIYQKQEKIIMTSVHIPYETKPNKWFEYEQQWKVACLDLLNRHVKESERTSTSVLDFGSGRGEFLQLLKDDGYQCQGVDFDPECVRLCSQIVPSRLADEASLPTMFDDKSFDVVSCIHVLEHLRNPAELVATLTKISRQYLLLAVPNLQSTSMIVARGKPYTANEGHVCGWDHAHFHNFLENICGLEVLGFGHDLVPFTTKFSKVDQFLEKVLPDRMLRNFEKGFLVKQFPYLSNTIIALCRVKQSQ